MCIFTPITLIAWPANRLLVQRKFGNAAMPLVVSAAVIAAGHAGFARYETSQAQTEIYDLMSTLYERGTDVLPAIIEPIRSVERFFSASKDVSQKEYAIFTRRMINQPGIDSIDWAPYVSATERSTFEEIQQYRGVINYRVFELDDRGIPSNAKDRSEYFPVAFTAPLKENEILLGLDHGSEVSRKQAILQAVTSGEIYSSWCYRCVLPRRNKILVYQPVFQPGFNNEGATEAGRRSSIRGFVVGEINVNALFASLADSATRKHIAFRITDVTPGDESRVVLGNLPKEKMASWNRELAFTNRLFLINGSSSWLLESRQHHDISAVSSVFGYHGPVDCLFYIKFLESESGG